jgi:hypothetical protein
VHRNGRPSLPPEPVALVVQDPGEELPVAPHPPVAAADGQLVVAGKLLEQVDIGDESGTGEQPLEQVVTQQRVLRHPPRERRLERVDVVDPLSRVGPLAEQVLVHIGDRGRIGVHAPGT